jgi:D-alanyl-D-alanine dipeptidase
MLLVLALIGLSACAESPKRMTLADASSDPRYQHLYQSMSQGGYRGEEFEWWDKLPMPKRD